MRYLVSVIDDATGSATAVEMAAIDAFNDQLREQGHWVMAAGLAAQSDATVIDNRGGKGVTVDGPHLQSAEFVSGFWIIDAPTREVALALAAEGSEACNRRVELRPFLGG